MRSQEGRRSSISWAAIGPVVLAVALVALTFWPRTKPPEPADRPSQPQQMRSLGHLSMAAGDSMEAVLIPTPFGIESALCVVYRNAQGAQMQCLQKEVLGQ